MGEVVGTDLICSVHYHEKHTIRVCVLPGGVLSPPQNPRWTKALSLDPKSAADLRTKETDVREEQKEQRGDKNRHLEEEANTRLFVQWE